MPRATTRFGHRSQMVARAGQSRRVGTTRSERSFAAADFAAARDSAAKTPGREPRTEDPQETQGIEAVIGSTRSQACANRTACRGPASVQPALCFPCRPTLINLIAPEESHGIQAHPDPS